MSVSPNITSLLMTASILAVMFIVYYPAAILTPDTQEWRNYGKMSVSLATYIFSILVAVLAVVYIMYPVPALTPEIEKWRNSGKYLKFKSFNIFYKVVKGRSDQGGTLLTIHGFPTSSHDWVKILDLGLLKNVQQVIFFDMLGYGLSQKPRNYDFSIMEQADIAEAILNHLDIKEFHLLAHDYGDTVALEMLARFNNGEKNYKIKTLCLSNGGVFPETNFPRPVQKLLALPYVGHAVQYLSSFPIFKRGFGDVFGPKTKPTEEELWNFYVLIRQSDGNLMQHKLINYIAERSKYKERWVGALVGAKSPVHMIYGPSDPVNPRQFIDHYKKTVPNPSITVLPDHIGHYPQWEAPQEFITAYNTFLQKQLK